MADEVTIILPRDVAQRYYDLQRESLAVLSSTMDRHDSDEEWEQVEEWASIVDAFEKGLK